LSSFERVARDTQEKTGRECFDGLRRGNKAFCVLDRQGVFTQVNTARSFGNGHIEAVIDDDARGARCLVVTPGNTA